MPEREPTALEDAFFSRRPTMQEYPMPRPYQGEEAAREEAAACVKERASGGWGDVAVDDGPSDAELAQAARTYGEGV